MLKTKTKKEIPSTSSKDATKKPKKSLGKKNRPKLSVCAPLDEDETQGFQNNDKVDENNVSVMTMTAAVVESSTKKTESFSTPKRNKKFCDMETPEARTQTRLTLKYDDLLLSQTVDPNCEVSWECISPEVVQKIHRDIQRKPNLDISNILSLLTDEDETPSSSSCNNNINTVLNSRPHVPCSKNVFLKKKLRSSRKDTTSSKMEEMIKKLEMQIKNEAEKHLADDSVNRKRIKDSSETLPPSERTVSDIPVHISSSPDLTYKCLPNIKESSSLNPKTTSPVDQSLDCEETSWSDDDLFCNESFIAKVAQTSESKTGTKMDKNKSFPADMVSDQTVNFGKKTLTLAHCKGSSMTMEHSSTMDKLTKSVSNEEFPKTSKSLDTIDSSYTRMTANSTNDIDLGFSDSDTDELLSQLTEQEISCSVQSFDKKKSLVTENACTDNTVGLSCSVPEVITDYKTNTKIPVIEKNSIDSYLEFLDIPMSDSFRRPSPRKSVMTADGSSVKKKFFNFKSTKSNNKLTNSNLSAKCSQTLSQNDNVGSVDNFDELFSDKDDDILRFAESLDTPEGNVQESESKKISSFIPTSKQNLPKAKSVCSKEEIERKKREALNRRRKLGAITKTYLK